MPGRTSCRYSALILVLSSVCLVGCGSGGGDPDPITRNVLLNGAQESTPNASAATGTATVTVSPDRQTITVNAQTTGLTNVTAAHIHAGLTGSAGLMGQDAPVVVPLFDSSTGTYTGTLNRTLTQANFTAQPGVGINFFQDLITAIRQGRAYINFHTQAIPTGEIRGQIMPRRFVTELSGSNEVPAVPGPGRGSATVTVDPSICTLTVNANTTSLVHSEVTLGHIHVGAVGANGPVIFPLFDSAQGAFNGTINRTLTATDLVMQPGSGINNCNDAINAILTGNAYVNLHSVSSPGGVVRGQLVPTESP